MHPDLKAKVEMVPPSPAPPLTPPELEVAPPKKAVVVHPATCDVCTDTIKGTRWKCLECPDWDCCRSCSKRVHEVHPRHTFVKIRQVADLVEPKEEDLKAVAVHKNILCDGEPVLTVQQKKTMLNHNRLRQGRVWRAIQVHAPVLPRLRSLRHL